MANIPEYAGTPSLLGAGGRQPRAGAEDFGSEIGDATQRFGGALQSIANLSADMLIQRKKLDNDKYVNDAESRFQDYFSTWLADEKNNSDLNVDMNFFLGAKKLQGEYEQAAPNAEAKDAIRSRLSNYISSRYSSIAQHAGGLRAADLLRSVTDNADLTLRTYSNEVGTPGIDATSNLLRSFPEQLAKIGESLPPAIARQVKDKYTADAAYALMDRSPAAAKKILDMGTVDGHSRRVIERAIAVVEDSESAVNSVVLQKVVADRIAQAKLGRMPANFSLQEILPFTSRDKADVLMSHANDSIETYNRSYEFVNRVSSYSGPAQVEELAKLEASANSDQDYAVLQLATAKVSDNVRNFQRDPAGYLLKNNPSIRSINDRLQTLPQGSGEVKQLLGERDALMLKFQGPPAVGDDAKFHHQVNRAQLKVMSDTEAQAAVQRINESSPNEALNTILNEVNQHPGNEVIAFNNLVTTSEGPGLRGDYWLVYKNWKNPAVKDLIGAIQRGKEFAKDTPEKNADFDKALDGYGPWRSFLMAAPQDNYQLQGMVDGYRSGIMTYAKALVQTTGISPELAVKKSVDTWVYTEMAGASVNGQKLLFDRAREGQSPMTDSEVKIRADSLGLALRAIDVSKIKLTDDWGRDHFPKLHQVGNDSTKLQVLRDQVLSSGFFKPSADGKSATLYVRNGVNSPFEVRDSNDRAFQIILDELPDLTHWREVGTFSGTHVFEFPGIDYQTPGVTTKEVKRTPRKGLMGFGYGVPDVVTESTTNWPVEPNWMRRR